MHIRLMASINDLYVRMVVYLSVMDSSATVYTLDAGQAAIKHGQINEKQQQQT